MEDIEIIAKKVKLGLREECLFTESRIRSC